MPNDLDLSQHINLDCFKFFGSAKFYTLFLLLTLFVGKEEVGNELLVVLVSSGLILAIIKVLVMAFTQNVWKFPSVTTGVATVFFLFVIQKRPAPLFMAVAALVWLMVHCCKVLDSTECGCVKTSLCHAISGTIIGAVVYWFERRHFDRHHRFL